MWCFFLNINYIVRFIYIVLNLIFVTFSFQERALTLDHPVKIGRSVARERPSSSNAIFDCKVLSRNHALLWYQSGKVCCILIIDYLQLSLYYHHKCLLRMMSTYRKI